MSEDLDDLTASLDHSGGIERINDFVYYLALNTNGFDSVGHYLRAGLLTNTCTPYSTAPIGPPCNATFYDPFSGAAASSASAKAGNAPASKLGRNDGSVAPRGTLLSELLGPGEKPALRHQREAGLRRLRDRAEAGSAGLGRSEPALEYLLGDER